MQHLICLTILVLLAACSESIDDNQDLSDYACNKAQLEMVELEMELCGKTNFYKSHCYQQARIAYCIKRPMTNTTHNMGDG